MKVGVLFHAGAPYAAPAESLRDAAADMRKSLVSCLPVMSGGVLVGVLTERDIVEATANGVRPSDGQVRDYMHDGGVAVSAEDDSSVAAARMLAVGCRHLPVLDRGELVGMVSAQEIFLVSAPRDVELLAAM